MEDLSFNISFDDGIVSVRPKPVIAKLYNNLNLPCFHKHFDSYITAYLPHLYKTIDCDYCSSWSEQDAINGNGITYWKASREEYERDLELLKATLKSFSDQLAVFNNIKANSGPLDGHQCGKMMYVTRNNHPDLIFVA
jgi:hypothetical protein